MVEAMRGELHLPLSEFGRSSLSPYTLTPSRSSQGRTLRLSSDHNYLVG